jgi:glycosyl transferase family 2
VHGTMCLIRRTALDSVGGWSSDTIVEDSDLGIAILANGWLAHYTNRRYGYGLLPDTFEAYKRQRQRWAFGGFQLVRKHWRHLLPWMPAFSREQKREFALGWLNWLGAESVGLVVALLNIVWVPIVAFANIAVPDRILTLPIIAAFVISAAHFVALYRLRVRVSSRQMFGAIFAAMSMQWTVAHAVGFGALKERLPFLRTAKGGVARKGPDFCAFWEAVIGGLLLLGALTLVVTNYKQVHEINIFAAVMVVQSLPFIAAVAIALIEGTRFNSLAYWQALETRTRELLPRTKTITIAEPAKLTAEKIEAAQ